MARPQVREAVDAAGGRILEAIGVSRDGSAKRLRFAVTRQACARGV